MQKPPLMSSCSSEAMSIFRPSVARTVGTALDRTIFNKTVPVAAARVLDVRNIAKYVKTLQSSRDIIGLERLRPTVLDPDSTFAKKGGKCILLKPEVNPKDPSTWSETIQKGVTEKELEVLPYDVKLDYDYYSYSEIMQALLPEDLLDEIPSGFAVVGHVAHLNIRDQYLPYKHTIAAVVKDKNPSIKTVINKIDFVGEQSEFRTFEYEVLLGEDDMNVEVVEGGCLFKFDFSKVYWNSRLETEHKRLVDLFQPGEVVCDVMAGIGPFALPAGKKGVFVFANDLNPECYAYMKQGIAQNKVENFVRPFNQDGHSFIGYTVNELIQLSVTDRNTVAIPAKRRFKAKPWQILPPTILTLPIIVNHFVMNLPASAIDFLGSFNSIYNGHEKLFEPYTKAKLPMVHVHCFSTKSADNARESVEICERISEKLGHKIKVGDPDLSIHDVRDVAPKKRMFCASFRLPVEVAFRDPSTVR